MKSEQLHSKILGLVSLIGLMGLWGCSKDETAEPKAQKGTEVQLMGYVAGYDDFTRAWTPPTGFSVFDTGDQTISVFFTKNDAGSYGEEYFYKENGRWKVSLQNNIQAGTYYFYGYMPHDKSINTTVSRLEGSSSFVDGAVVSMRNVPAVSPADFCVIIGAKNGASANENYSTYSETGLKRGDFQYVATGEHNYVYLLFDHLFSALHLKMRVQGTYNNLRTIKLKELKLKTYEGEEGSTPSKKKTDITITLTANNAGNDPITDITFTPSGEDTDAGSVFTSETGFPLNADYQEFTGHFMPQGVTKVNLISTYDVYDKKGNLVRSNCTATNTLNLNMFSGQTQALRGCRYTISLTINPTYLYMLSEPDLDNPTVQIEN